MIDQEPATEEDRSSPLAPLDRWSARLVAYVSVIGTVIGVEALLGASRRTLTVTAIVIAGVIVLAGGGLLVADRPRSRTGSLRRRQPGPISWPAALAVAAAATAIGLATALLFGRDDPKRPPLTAAEYRSAVRDDDPTTFLEFSGVHDPTALRTRARASGCTDHGEVGTGRSSPFGRDGSAIRTAGLDGYLECATQPGLRGSHARTVELWLRTTSRQTQTLFRTGAPRSHSAFRISIVAPTAIPQAPERHSGLYVGFWDTDVYVPATVTDDRWHHLAVATTGDDVILVLDGRQPAGYVYDGGTYAQRASQPFHLANAIKTAVSPILIGAGSPDEGEFAHGFTGTLADIAIFDRALTPDQIAAQRG